MEEELQIFLAAGPEECYDFLIFLHRFDNFGSRQRAAAVLVDELEALPSRVEEIAREFRNLALRREGGEQRQGRPLLLRLPLNTYRPS